MADDRWARRQARSSRPAARGMHLRKLAAGSMRH